MTGIELEKNIIRAEYEYERMKDSIHDLYDEKNELYERIFDLETLRYKLEDTIEDIIQILLHSHITLEEMEKVGALNE